MKFTTFISGVVAGMTFLLAGSGIVSAIDGVATYYTQQGVAGSCGVYHSDADYIVALGPAWGHNNNCGRTVNIRHKTTGHVVTAVVADTCPSCEQTKLDVSVGVYQALNGFVGLDNIPIDWHFN